MRTEIVNIIANQGINQLEYYKNLYLVYKKFIKLLLIIISTIIICLSVFLVCYYLKF